MKTEEALKGVKKCKLSAAQQFGTTTELQRTLKPGTSTAQVGTCLVLALANVLYNAIVTPSLKQSASIDPSGLGSKAKILSPS